MGRPGSRRWWTWVLGIGATALALAILVPVAIWKGLAHEPVFYREVAPEPGPERTRTAERFVEQSLQLRNDIANEPTWEAVFSQDEVNAWLAEDLVAHFADQVPPGVSDPRLVFETDRVMFGFRYDKEPIKAVVWVVAAIRIPESNMVELTIEKVRAGLIPIQTDTIFDRLIEYGRERGLEICLDEDIEGHRVARIAYDASLEGAEIALEEVRLLPGQVRLRGRSSSEAVIDLPDDRQLQASFPQVKDQSAEDGPSVPEASESSARAGSSRSSNTRRRS